MRDKQALFKAQNKAQSEKLDLYGHKPDWKDSDLSELISSLLGEVEELKQEFTQNGSYENMRKEAADVANYCGMIIQKLDNILSPMCDTCVYMDAPEVCIECNDYDEWSQK